MNIFELSEKYKQAVHELKQFKQVANMEISFDESSKINQQKMVEDNLEKDKNIIHLNKQIDDLKKTIQVVFYN